MDRYNLGRKALESLGAHPGYLKKFPTISKKDLKLSADVVEENRTGQRSDSLAWFWRLDGAGIEDGKNDKWMVEGT